MLRIKDNVDLKKLKKYIENGAKIKSIITKEMFDSIKYEVQ